MPPRMSKREVTEVDDLIDRIRDLTTREAIGQIEAEVRQLLAADEQRVVVDGFPSRTPGNGNPGGGKGGGPLMVVEDEDGRPDRVPMSTTEAAALTEQSERDPVHDLAGEARRSLHAVADSLERLRRTLDKFARLRSTGHEVVEGRWCHVAKLVHGLAWDPEWEVWRTTDFAGVLTDPFEIPVGVSRYVYWYTRNHRRLPSKDEMLRHLEAAGERAVAAASV